MLVCCSPESNRTNAGVLPSKNGRFDSTSPPTSPAAHPSHLLRFCAPSYNSSIPLLLCSQLSLKSELIYVLFFLASVSPAPEMGSQGAEEIKPQETRSPHNGAHCWSGTPQSSPV